MAYCNIEVLEVGKTHHVWDSIDTGALDVKKGIVKVRMLTGVYNLQKLKAKFSKGKEDAKCPLCFLDVEDIDHLISSCPEMASSNQSPVKIGFVAQDDRLGYDLHTSALNGNKKRIKRALEKGIHVDYPNSFGQSPLFGACYENQESAVEQLLKFGANPNERSNNGITPVHIAAYSGNLKIVTELLSEGGDLRLHDSRGRTAKDWALMQPDPKKRLKMIEFLEKTRLFALTQSGQDIRSTENQSHLDRRYPGSIRNNSIIRLIKDRIKGESTVNLEHLKSSHSMGYGKVYLDHERIGGIVCSIPLVSENYLQHDRSRITYDNGAFTVMQSKSKTYLLSSMMWRKTRVTAKRLHRDVDPGVEVDLLITEAEYLGRVRHANIIQLMGICQTDNLDGIVLIFENVVMGSLFYHLHTKLERIPSTQIKEMSLQIAEAVLFLHDQNLLHCCITSHAVNIINPHLAKLGNFEYMLEREKADLGKTSVVNRNINPLAAYNWMSPEIMNNSPPTEKSDMYSYCTVLWEMLHSRVPWDQLEVERIQEMVSEKREQLQIDTKRVPEGFYPILEYGLQHDPLHRSLSFEHVIDILSLPSEDIDHYVKKVIKPKRPKTSPAQSNKTSQKSHRKEHKKHPAARENGGRKKSYRHEDLDLDYNHNGGVKGQEKSRNGYHQQRFVDRMQFSHKNLDWNLQEEQQDDAYYYCIDVKPEDKNQDVQQSPTKYRNHDVNQSPKYKIHDVHQSPTKYKNNDVQLSPKNYTKYTEYYDDAFDKQSDLETCSSSQDQLREDSQLIDSKQERPLASRFSYLQVQQALSPPGACTIKPASHCTAPMIEKPQEKQLTTAGSIYALYNMNSNDDQFTPSRPNIALKSLNSTMPRKRKRNEATPEIRPRVQSLKGDVNWFGGKGSVKDLVELYQNQADEMDQHSHHPRKIDFKCSNQTERPTVPSLYPDLENRGEVTNSSSLTTVSNSSSVESAVVEKWVSKEMQHIQNYPASPLLFDEDQFQGDNNRKKSPVKSPRPKTEHSKNFSKRNAEKLGAYQSTVTVKSSHREPDKHVVTHTLTDLMDGTSSTLYGKTVKAEKVSTAFFSNC
ncbi:hypothetical protein FSP39_002264 [Pinctada imbricata]|uniref:Protein kinase domain-containing protein n=1 Tax=Pinctada imbricata TaxID=66713 RepID=A0AA89BS97_PINIB|nr:hypothetical protein FSP39_002264 [Pinctada imbricata]